MSDDTTFVDVADLRGWAKTWDWMSSHLTEQEKVHNTTLIGLDMSLWNAAAAEIDKAAGELLRSGIYTTFVANAAEVADGRAYTVDHIGFAAAIFGGGGALSATDERVYSTAINDDDRDLTGGGFGTPPAPPAGSGSGSRSGPEPERPFEVDTDVARLQPYDPAWTVRDTPDAILRPGVPVAPGGGFPVDDFGDRTTPTPIDDGGKIFPGVLVDGVWVPADPDDQHVGDRDWDVRPVGDLDDLGGPHDRPAVPRLGTSEGGPLFDDGGYVGPVLPPKGTAPSHPIDEFDYVGGPFQPDGPHLTGAAQPVTDWVTDDLGVLRSAPAAEVYGEHTATEWLPNLDQREAAADVPVDHNLAGGREALPSV